jgi:hypothetical protein
MHMPRDIPGQWIALVIVILTLAGAITSIAYHHASSNAAQDFLGAGGMMLAAQSPEAELLVIGQEEQTDPTAPAGEKLSIDGREWPIVRRHDLRMARGILNLRHALRQDASYDFSAAVSLDPPWVFAIRLADGARTLTLAFDPAGRRVAVVETGRAAGLAEKTAAGLATFLADFEPGR